MFDSTFSSVEGEFVSRPSKVRSQLPLFILYLIQRLFTIFEEIKTFFSPALRKIYYSSDPYHYNNIKRIVSFNWKMADSSSEAPQTVDYIRQIILDRPSLQIKENCQCNPLVITISDGGYVFGKLDIRFNKQLSVIELSFTVESKYSGQPISISIKNAEGSYLSNTAYRHSKNIISLDIPDEAAQEETCTIEVRVLSLSLREHEIESTAIIKNTRQSFGALRGMFEGELFTDFVLNVSGEKINAHKVILAGSSRYFEAMFASGMVESQRSYLEIEDSEPETIRAMLDFIYSGELRQPCKRVFEGKDTELKKTNSSVFYSRLFLAADKYQIDGLKQECAKVLCSLITSGSAGGILSIALDHKLNYLRDLVAKFILGSDRRDECFFNQHYSEYRYSL